MFKTFQAYGANIIGAAAIKGTHHLVFIQIK